MTFDRPDTQGFDSARVGGMCGAACRPASALAFALALLGAAVCSATQSTAQAAASTWRPTKPVEFVIMAGRGGGADKATRRLIDIIANNKFAEIRFAPVNVSGRSGADALAKLKAAGNDDHMLLFTLNSFYTAPLLHPELAIDVTSYAPIGRMAEDAFLLWVHSDRKDIRSFDEFIEVVRAAGPNWVMAGTGTGAEDNLLTDFLNATFKLKMRYVPFDGGGRVARELAEGRANSTVNNPSEQSKYHPAGQTKPIATFTKRRLPEYRRAAALREAGIEFQYTMQRSVVGPPGMSQAARQYWTDLFRRVFEHADWQSYRTKNSLTGDFLTGGDLQAYWRRERERHERWRMAISVMGR